jgi:hypothetical protein
MGVLGNIGEELLEVKTFSRCTQSPRIYPGHLAKVLADKLSNELGQDNKQCGHLWYLNSLRVFFSLFYLFAK